MTTAISVDDLADQIATLAAHIDAAGHTLSTHIREFDQRGGWSLQGAKSCAHWLSWRIGMDAGAAREQVRVAKALGGFAKIDDAFRRGTLSYSKVRAITRVATPALEETLLDLALATTATQLETACRKFRQVQPLDPKHPSHDRYVSRRSLANGMIKVEAVLLADEAALLWALLDRRAANVSAETRAFDRADALMAIVNAAARGERAERTPVELVVAVDVKTGTGVTGDGTALPAKTIERLACDAGVVPILEENGNALNVGRKYRTATPAIKRALALREPHCQYPGCSHRLFLHSHHLIHWLLGGVTSLENTCRLCTFHHALVHEGGFKCLLEENGKVAFFDPRGRRVVANPTTPVDLGMPALEGAHASLAIDASTNAPRWDGSAPDYVAIVDDLCRTAGIVGRGEFRITGDPDEAEGEWTVVS